MDIGTVGTVAEALSSLMKFIGSQPIEGEPAERASTARLVVAAMQHLAFEIVRTRKDAGTEASIRVKKDGTFFELGIGNLSIEIQPHEEGFFIQFGGLGLGKRDRGLIPLGDRIQHVALPTLHFDEAIATARGLNTKIVALLDAMLKVRSA